MVQRIRPRPAALLSATALLLALVANGQSLLHAQPPQAQVGGPAVSLTSTSAETVPPTLALASADTEATSPSTTQAHTFYSAALQRDMPYLVYLPPGYRAGSGPSYPVLYMLHGLGGRHTSWQDDGLLAAADRLIKAGAIAPLIIVLPEGGASYWVDHVSGGPRWGTYVARDLVAEIDARYNSVSDPRGRAIGGMSMGGHGALQLALTHPNVFHVVGAHSVALRDHQIAFPFFGDREAFSQRDPVSLCARNPEVARGLALWIDIGTGDAWAPRAAAFHKQLGDLDIPHRWTTWAGGHSDDYWRAHVEDYLTYYDDALTQPVRGALVIHG